MEQNLDVSFVRVFALKDFKPGAKRVETVGDHEVGIFNIDGEIYAVDDVCPHVDGPLHSGPVDNAKKTVTCPLHAWEFSLETGWNCEGRRAVVAVFDTDVRDGDVYVAAEPRPAVPRPPKAV